MRKTTVQIDGVRLRAFVVAKCGGKRQKHIAADLGCSEYALSRWMAPGVRHVTRDKVDRIATYCGVSLDALLTECGPRDDVVQIAGATPSEQYWLELYRRLSPGEQAKAMTMVMDWSTTISR